MHKTAGLRDPAAAFPSPTRRDDVQERRQANRAIGVSAAGLAATGIIELLLAVLTGSVGLLGDAIHNLSDVSTSAVKISIARSGASIPLLADAKDQQCAHAQHCRPAVRGRLPLRDRIMAAVSPCGPQLANREQSRLPYAVRLRLRDGTAGFVGWSQSCSTGA